MFWLCRDTIIHLVCGNLKGIFTCQVAQPGRASNKCLVEYPQPQPRRVESMVVLSLITNHLLWNQTSIIGGSGLTWSMMWVPTMWRFFLMGRIIPGTMDLAVEPALTTSSLGFTHRMVLPTTWNLVGGISRFLKNRNAVLSFQFQVLITQAKSLFS